MLIFGITMNLGLLAYFKYANFFVENINLVLATQLSIANIVLPLAISFFTFQQIAYLVDAWKGETKEYSFLHYCLFVCFFPQLIAGPIVHHKEMLPQILRPTNLRPQATNFVIGITIFAIGFFKKTVIADNLALYVSPVFDNTNLTASIDFFTAWGSALAYTLQLYFDFSGYSEMAIGCARLFGVKLPINFFSPYKSTSIVEFWRRWHITLSRFLRDYLYIALGGNRHGKVRRYTNLLLTMVLGGLWHGAGWTFVIWGCLHGFYLVVNHAWVHLLKTFNLSIEKYKLYQLFSWALTLLAVVVGWVYFRAPNLEQANTILLAMAGEYGANLPSGIYAQLGGMSNWLADMGVGISQGGGKQLVLNALWVVVAAAIALKAPNVVEIFASKEKVSCDSKIQFQLSSLHWLQWDYNNRWVAKTALMLVFGILTLTQVSEFLYFQF
ncbi:MBOAT family O-acyltransferase [Spartinivicinus ruber]|uniref:MBOAT family O-acyltransferase n=1 Tax=Spartinivicinus ruber TaxID=2683272 RepID=UPI001CA3FFB9|nr:MBOAT family O-acyltransferase [Spartinivicinus ruber]